MARHIVARYSLLDALGLCLIFSCMNELAYFVVELLFITGCFYKLRSHQHMRFFSVSMMIFMLLMQKSPRVFPILHFFSTTVIGTVVASEQKGPTQLFLCQGIVVLFAYLCHASNLLFGNHAPTLAELLDLSIVPRDPRLDKIAFVSRFSVPISCAFLGTFVLVDSDGRKSRQPGIWKLAAYLRLTFQPSPRGQNLEYKVRYVQDHLVGLVVNLPANTLLVKVDAVEWTQLWTQDNLLIIYGLSPRVDYTVRLEAQGGEYRDITVSTNVPEKLATHNRVRRQTPMTTLLEAREIAVSTLAEEKAKNKKMRRDQNKVLGQLRNEIDTFSEKHSRSNKGDERLARKAHGLQEATRQLQEDIEEIQAATLELEQSKPESDAVYHVREREYLEKSATLSKQEALIDAQLAELGNLELNTQQELSSNQERKMRLQEKIRKTKHEVDTITRATDLAMSNVIAHREKARKQKFKRRDTQKQEFESSIQKLEIGVQDVLARTRLFDEARSNW